MDSLVSRVVITRVYMGVNVMILLTVLSVTAQMNGLVIHANLKTFVMATNVDPTAPVLIERLGTNANYTLVKARHV